MRHQYTYIESSYRKERNDLVYTAYDRFSRRYLIKKNYVHQTYTILPQFTTKEEISSLDFKTLGECDNWLKNRKEGIDETLLPEQSE